MQNYGIPQQHKYHAQPVEVDGIRFASTKEATRYGVLRLLEKQGEIFDLSLQPKFPYIINGIKCFSYKADFSYLDQYGELIIEDVKGFKTPMYKLKKKIIEAAYKIKITEV